MQLVFRLPRDIIYYIAEGQVLSSDFYYIQILHVIFYKIATHSQIQVQKEVFGLSRVESGHV